MISEPVTVLLENSRCSSETAMTMTNGRSTGGTRMRLPSSSWASQRAAPVSNTISPSDRPATISITPPQSMLAWASFQDMTRTRGRNSVSPPARATACTGGSTRPPVRSASQGVTSQVVMVSAKTAKVLRSTGFRGPRAASLASISPSP